MIEKLRVLVVDDQTSMRQLMISTLHGLGVKAPTGVENGEQALTILQSGRIDLVLLDIEMPGMGGIATLQAIRGARELASLPVIMMTGRSQQTVVKELLALGISGYLLKPVSAAALKARIETAMRPRTPAPGRAGTVDID